MGHIREGKYLDSGIWLILQMGPDEAGRLIRRARGGDASARSQLEHCMIKFLQNPGLAAAVMEDASLLDVELVPAEPRGEGGKADWKRLRLDLPIGKRGPRPSTDTECCGSHDFSGGWGTQEGATAHGGWT